jgi:ABC-type multidrug transport system fused ATPase/permease subunit
VRILHDVLQGPVYEVFGNLPAYDAVILSPVFANEANVTMIKDVMVQFGLNPSNLSYEAIFNRLVDIALANMNIANMLALGGATLYVTTLMMRTIVPLRIIGIISILFFIAYGALAGAVATFLLYLMSLPINIYRLHQMLDLVKKARASARDDLSMDWLKPFMTPRKYRKGDVLFRKGAAANEMFYIVTGTFLVREIGVKRAPGEMIGELGFLSENNYRTQTVECIESGAVLTITYDKLLELYFQNPEFGYYFLHLTNGRLTQNIKRLEAIIEQNRKAELETGAPKTAN